MLSFQSILIIKCEYIYIYIYGILWEKYNDDDCAGHHASLSL